MSVTLQRIKKAALFCSILLLLVNLFMLIFMLLMGASVELTPSLLKTPSEGGVNYKSPTMPQISEGGGNADYKTISLLKASSGGKILDFKNPSLPQIPSLGGIADYNTPSLLKTPNGRGNLDYKEHVGKLLKDSPCYGVSPGNPSSWKPVFISVILADPSETKVHSYAFLRCCLDNKFILQKEDMHTVHRSIIPCVRSSRKLRRLIGPLLQKSIEFVPKRFQKNTPALVRITSSIRGLISRRVSNKLIAKVTSILRASPFKVKAGQVTIAKRSAEAADTWLSAMFLTGLLYSTNSTPLAVADLREGSLSVAIPLSHVFPHQNKGKNMKQNRPKRRSTRENNDVIKSEGQLALNVQRRRLRHNDSMKFPGRNLEFFWSLISRNHFAFESPLENKEGKTEVSFSNDLKDDGKSIFREALKEKKESAGMVIPRKESRSYSNKAEEIKYSKQNNKKIKYKKDKSGKKPPDSKTFIPKIQGQPYIIFPYSKYKRDKRESLFLRGKTLSYNDSRLLKQLNPITYPMRIKNKINVINLNLNKVKNKYYIIQRLNKRNIAKYIFRIKMDLKLEKRTHLKDDFLAFFNEKYAEEEYLPLPNDTNSRLMARKIENFRKKKFSKSFRNGRSKERRTNVKQERRRYARSNRKVDYKAREEENREKEINVKGNENGKYNLAGNKLCATLKVRNRIECHKVSNYINKLISGMGKQFSKSRKQKFKQMKTKNKANNFSKLHLKKRTKNTLENNVSNSRDGNPKKFQNNLETKYPKIIKNILQTKSSKKVKNNLQIKSSKNDKNIDKCTNYLFENENYLNFEGLKNNFLKIFATKNLNPKCSKIRNAPPETKQKPQPLPWRNEGLKYGRIQHKEKEGKNNEKRQQKQQRPQQHNHHHHHHHQQQKQQQQKQKQQQLIETQKQNITYSNFEVRKVIKPSKISPDDARGTRIKDAEPPRRRQRRRSSRRTRAEERRSYFLSVTHRCSPTKKFWLFANSYPLGIFPARVSVLFKDISLRSNSRHYQKPYSESFEKSFHAVQDPKRRSDITPEQEYKLNVNNLPKSNATSFINMSTLIPQPHGPGPPPSGKGIHHNSETSSYSNNDQLYTLKTKDLGENDHWDPSNISNTTKFKKYNWGKNNSYENDTDLKKHNFWGKINNNNISNGTEDEVNITENINNLVDLIPESSITPMWTAETFEKVKTVVDSLLKALGTSSYENKRADVHQTITQDYNNSTFSINAEISNHSLNVSDLQLNSSKSQTWNLIPPKNHLLAPIENRLILVPTENPPLNISSKTVAMSDDSPVETKRKDKNNEDDTIKSTGKLVITSLTDFLFNFPSKSPNSKKNVNSKESTDKKPYLREFHRIPHTEPKTRGNLKKSFSLLPNHSDELVIESSCIPLASKGKFTINDVTYVVKGRNSTDRVKKCQREVEEMIQRYVKVPPVKGMQLLATSTFNFIAKRANLIDSKQSFGYVKPFQFQEAANEICNRPIEAVGDPHVCLDYQYVAGLLLKGFNLLPQEQIMVCDQIGGFELNSALGLALSYLQRH